MKRAIVGAFLSVALLALVAVAAGAEELTVNSILAAQQSGAPAHGIIAMVNNPANTIAMTAGDLITLRKAGVPESVVIAIWARIPAPAQAVPLQPDDARLVDFVRLIKSGMSESIIADQVKQSGRAYSLSVNDLVYLKQNGAQESMIAALMATNAGATAEPVAAPVAAPAASPAAAPAEVVFDDLVLVKPTFLRKDRQGRLVMRGDVFTWVDNRDPRETFTFQTTGLKKVWFTCEARTPENFCYQINFKIVKGDRYRFRDIHSNSGSNAAVTKIMEALRTYFPRLAFGAPDN
ncbi:MAG: hypothetical protein ACHQQS_15725 [Thermoanaerobaculales bacterium]